MKQISKTDLKTAAKLTQLIVDNKQSVFYQDKILKIFLQNYIKKLQKGNSNV